MRSDDVRFEDDQVREREGNKMMWWEDAMIRYQNERTIGYKDDNYGIYFFDEEDALVSLWPDNSIDRFDSVSFDPVATLGVMGTCALEWSFEGYKGSVQTWLRPSGDFFFGHSAMNLTPFKGIRWDQMDISRSYYRQLRLEEVRCVARPSSVVDLQTLSMTTT
eukprot:762733-Hanusia_phi.AAC.7